jgi:hypothetical protein
LSEGSHSKNRIQIRNKQKARIQTRIETKYIQVMQEGKAFQREALQECIRCQIRKMHTGLGNNALEKLACEQMPVL